MAGRKKNPAMRGDAQRGHHSRAQPARLEQIDLPLLCDIANRNVNPPGRSIGRIQTPTIEKTVTTPPQSGTLLREEEP
jgi:hypothetical protein